MKPYLYRSIALHIAALIIFMFDWHVLFRPKITIGAAPIIVDLQDVKLAEMTNLPPKAVLGDEEKKATVAEKTKPQYTKEDPIPKAEEPKPEVKEEPIKEAFVNTDPEPEPKPEPVKEQKPTPKPAPKSQKKPILPSPKKPAPKPTPKPKEAKKPEKPKEIATVKNSLKSLMDSVNSLEKEVSKESSPAVIKKGTEVKNMGVEGGKEGSYFSDLTITETDAIAGRLRECWNFDPGAQNVEGIIIEIRAFLNRDGTVRDVKIVDSFRANSDPRFRAIAESARRAVLSCQNHKGVNIYKIFADKYADKYDLWNTLMLKFNPMDNTVN